MLLTSDREASYLGAILRRYDPDLAVCHVATLAALRDRLGRPGPRWRRLVGFCTGEIVPRTLLAACSGGAYNFHPGSPTFPGKYPECFAAYQGAERFGATVHEMAPRVDSGAIVGVEWFDVPRGAGRMVLADLAYQATVRLFVRVGPALIAAASPMPRLSVSWSGHKSTQAEIDRMRQVTPEMTRSEFERRRRAFGEGPEAGLWLMLHGYRFDWRAGPWGGPDGDDTPSP
ncbi:MAG: formyltransferase family protein [Azospirillaceae bacterium]|nr:formyltransferase family protein [Azospirillaceae bacterium]